MLKRSFGFFPAEQGTLVKTGDDYTTSVGFRARLAFGFAGRTAGFGVLTGGKRLPDGRAGGGVDALLCMAGWLCFPESRLFACRLRSDWF